MGPAEYNEKKWEMKVNGRPVTAMTTLGHDAIVLENSDGLYFPPNDGDDEFPYNFELKVNEPDSFVKISAFVLY